MERDLGRYVPSRENAEVEIPTLRRGLDRYPDPDLDIQPVEQVTKVTDETTVSTDDPELNEALFSGRRFWER